MGGSARQVLKILSWLILCLTLTGCSPKFGFFFYTVEQPKLMVLEDQYILEADGPWCPLVGNKQGCDGLPPGVYALEGHGSDTRVMLVTSKQLGVLMKPKAVEYDPKKDKCLTLGKKNCSPNYIVSVDQWQNLWGIKNINVEEAWKGEGKEAKVRVSVIDTGVDCSHSDLKDQCVGSFDAITGEEDQVDQNGHGTHVAGTICAKHNGQGVGGVVSECELLAAKFLGANGSGSMFDAIKAIDWSVDNGAKIINASWGSRGYSQPLFNAIKRAEEAGVLFVAAAGNSRSDNDALPHFPSSMKLPNVLAVASLQEGGDMSSFSNYGKKTVHIAAPGSNICSTWPGGGTNCISGTSMATPHVAGVASLLWKGDYQSTIDSIFQLAKKSDLKVQQGRKLKASSVDPCVKCVSSCCVKKKPIRCIKRCRKEHCKKSK